MAEITQTQRADKILNDALKCCKDFRHEFVMPEHLLYALLGNDNFHSALSIFYPPEALEQRLVERLRKTESVPGEDDYIPEASVQTGKVLEIACQQVYYSSAKAIDITHLTMGLLHLEDSWACYLLKDALGDKDSNFMSHLIHFVETEDAISKSTAYGDPYDDDIFDNEQIEQDEAVQKSWKRLVTCMNNLTEAHNPLIGREEELKRTMQVLCRKEKNNPLHIGESGVGKTALVWGLARRINAGKVPERLKDSRIYMLDIGSLLAGTQYRGDFENRIKLIMDGIAEEAGNNIVYIDEIHNLVGAGATGESSMDASNMLKPYLEAGQIRFIGSTTYEEYNRHFSKSKGLVRRFQQIDIGEPSEEEAINILQQLKPAFEEFHGVKYDDECIEYAVRASAKYVNERFLPDKAIDLIDEAGASLECKADDVESAAAHDANAAKTAEANEKLHTPNSKLITKALIAEVLSKTCKVDALAMKDDDDNAALETLYERISDKIYGQDEAVRQVVEAVQMSKAGLLDDGKPLASLLFVGPTGVGKTEVARVLAKELGIELLRFDMSEYTEKHTVAKLIGSPAGYVGYEDGGLLTDAIRKTPNCVLLLDEIEKAHQDIYNILLQVMDYARLTDNKGRKADFRNVILIMTSNAGAQYAGQASIGFSGSVSRGEAMLRQVKKTFKPEFINRLSGTVVFNDMDRHMATLILRKKLGELQEKLTARRVQMTLSDEAFDSLLNEGFTREYGAREMDRVITSRLKPLLMRQILFGSLKQGGNVTVLVENGELSISKKE